MLRRNREEPWFDPKICCYRKRGWYCTRQQGHSGSCALKPRWWVNKMWLLLVVSVVLMITSVLLVLSLWGHHKKPAPQTPPPPISATAYADSIPYLELDDDLAALIVVKEKYPWLRPWAEPTIMEIDLVLAGQSGDQDEAMKDIRTGMQMLTRMEYNDTI